MKQVFIIKASNPNSARVHAAAVQAVNDAQGEFQVTIGEIKRSLDANACMWASLTDFTKHVGWMVTDSHGQSVPAAVEDVKDILTAAFEGETRMAPGLRGGVVIIGARTSKYSKRKMGEFLTFLHAEGDERGVVWSEKAKDDFAEWGR